MDAMPDKPNRAGIFKAIPNPNSNATGIRITHILAWKQHMLNENQARHWITLRRAHLGDRALAFYHVLVWLAVPTLPMVPGWRLPVGDTPPTTTCKEKVIMGDRTKPCFGESCTWTKKQMVSERAGSKITLSLIDQSTHAVTLVSCYSS